MSTYATGTQRRGYSRDADRAVLGGVLAGFADYFGFNLCVLRILGVIAFLTAMPVTIIAYLAVVLLVPATSSGRSTRQRHRSCRRERRSSRESRKSRKLREAREAREDREQAYKAARERFGSLDDRLARIEKYVTSPRYELDREISKL